MRARIFRTAFREVVISLTFLSTGLYVSPQTCHVGSWGYLVSLIGWLAYIGVDAFVEWGLEHYNAD